MGTDVMESKGALADAEKQQTSPRKRRRRAPTTGAADDCFTCQERRATCDRRRPYCSQCLEFKVTCSGYKTQLTWGVGVASRGKLRGLSLPVAKIKKPGLADKPAPRKKSRSASTSSTLKTDGTTESATSHGAAQDHPATATTYTFATAPTAYAFVGVDPAASVPSSAPALSAFQWAATATYPAPTSAPHDPIRSALLRRSPKVRRHTLGPLHVSTSSVPRYRLSPGSAGGIGGYGDSRYEHAVEDSPTITYQSPDGSMPIYGTPPPRSSLPTGSLLEIPSHHSGAYVGAWLSDTISSSPSSGHDSNRGDGFFPDPLVTSPLDFYPGDQLSALHDSDLSRITIKEELDGDDGAESEEADRYNQFVASQCAGTDLYSFMPRNRVGKTKDLQYLINYYDEVISPVIVAFNGPTNPYRLHILRLANESEGLQHAIAALSASNLRMRREHPSEKRRPLLLAGSSAHELSVWRSSEAHERLNHEPASLEFTKPGAPTSRELFHRRQAIRALNDQLADPVRMTDDTILATLLVLCLYHSCETGVAKFRTQFAGVKSIMALRHNHGTQSPESKWLITMFKWFDAMTATVNDREGQFSSVDEPVCHLGSFDATDDWALENLAGCDSRLFRTISRLGRLNMLSQSREVSPSSHDLPFAKTLPSVPLPGPQAPYLHPELRFDGSGWASLLPCPEPTFTQEAPDTRYRFWTEWRAIRNELVSWSFVPTSLPRPMRSPAPYSTPTSAPVPCALDANAADLANISESFRVAALLYTERLAYPAYPSAAPNFQGLVSRALQYIAIVKSDVFLLWPLFIVGTECVRGGDRELVRQRCLAIQKDSGFYNNIKCLELLEVVWRRADEEARDGVVHGLRADEGAFRWRREMVSPDGEYIVI